MIYLNGQIGAVYLGGHYHSEVYLGSVLVWSGVKKIPGEAHAHLAFANTAEGVAAVLLPDRAYSWLMRYECFGMLLLLAVISVGIGSNALDSAIRWTFTLLCRLVGFEV